MQRTMNEFESATCPKCGKELIAPTDSDKPDYCWCCDIQYGDKYLPPSENKILGEGVK